MSKAENIYNKQLEEWSKVVSQMNQQVTALLSLARSAATPTATGVGTSSGTGSVTGTPTPPAYAQSQMQSPRSTRKNPPLFSLSSSSPAVTQQQQQQQQQQQTYRSPIGSAALLSPTTINTNARVASGNTSTFSTPQTGGAFRSQAGATFRPYATPSTPQPNASSSTPFAASRQQQQQQQQHGMATPSSSMSSTKAGAGLYSGYRSSSSFSTTAGATAGGMGTSATGTLRGSSVAHSTPRHAQDSHAGAGIASTGTPAGAVVALQLSTEDQQACSELLVAQTKLLEKSQQELSNLEQRLKVLRAAHIVGAKEVM